MTAAPTLEFPLLDVRRGDPAFVRDLLERPGVLERGHYELLSGLHADVFIRFSVLARDEDALNFIGEWLTPSLKPWNVDAVVAPATAGVALGWALARRLSVPLHLAAPCDDGRAIEVNTPNALVGQRVLLVNDVVTTGAGMRALAGVVESAGGEVAGAAWFASRSPVDVEVMIAAPAVCVVALALAAYAADECEFCRDGGAVERAVDLN